MIISEHSDARHNTWMLSVIEKTVSGANLKQSEYALIKNAV